MDLMKIFVIMQNHSKRVLNASVSMFSCKGIHNNTTLFRDAPYLKLHISTLIPIPRVFSARWCIVKQIIFFPGISIKGNIFLINVGRVYIFHGEK